MSLHPTLTAALADEHRRDLMSQASASRLARTARQSSPRNPARRPLIVRAFRTAAAATAIAAGAFLMIPAGPGHAPSAHSSWGEHYRTSDSHRAVLADHYRTHHFSADHRFSAGHVFAGRWA